MVREQKKVLVKTIAEKFSQYDSFYIVEFSKISVRDVNLIRSDCYKKGVKYIITKNTFFLKALSISNKNIDAEGLRRFFKGNSAVFFINEDNYNFPAKIIKKFQTKICNFLSLKCAYIDGELFYGESQLDMLNNMKSKSQLIAETVNMLFVPLRGVLSGLLCKNE